MRPFLCFRTRIRITLCLMVGMTATTLSWAQVDPAQVDPIKLVDLVAQSHGQARSPSSGPPVKIGDWMAEGTLTLFRNGQPEDRFSVVLAGKEEGRFQRVVYQEGGQLRQGTDGLRGWNSLAGQLISRPAGMVQAQLESCTSRSVQALFQHRARDLRLEYQWMEDGHYVIDAVRGPERTRYLIDEVSFLVSSLEFEFGVARDLFGGQSFPQKHRVEFWDYRTIQGIETPFRIAYWIDSIQVEEIVLDSVSYNIGLWDGVFTP